VHRRTSFSSGELRELSRFFLSSPVPLGLCHPSIVCAPDRAFLSYVPLHYSQGTYIFQLCKHTWSEKLSACVQVMAHFCQQAVPQCAQELCTRYFASVRVTSSHVMPRSPSTFFRVLKSVHVDRRRQCLDEHLKRRPAKVCPLLHGRYLSFSSGN
jgi:hypothetical protein